MTDFQKLYGIIYIGNRKRGKSHFGQLSLVQLHTSLKFCKIQKH